MTTTTALLFALGLVALVVGANALVRGAAKLALRLGLSPLVVGLTVVAFGTSAPEMAVTVGGVLSGQGDLAVGNAVGSNIFNVLFILGLAALIAPLTVHQQIIRQEVPVMVGGALLLVFLGQDGAFGLADGLLLLGLLLAYTALLVQQARSAPAAERAPYDAALAPPARQWDDSLAAQIGLIALGLLLLVLGAGWLVEAAVTVARALGLSEAVIGLTIVAAGTSLPEVAASVAASLKGERDIAVGNVVGSCVFNIFGVVGLGAVVAALGTGAPLPLPAGVAHFDLWVMVAALMACLPVFVTGRKIARWEGALLLGYYVAYTVYLVMVVQHRPGVQAFAHAMLGFVVPLTIVTLGVALLRPGR